MAGNLETGAKPHGPQVEEFSLIDPQLPFEPGILHALNDAFGVSATHVEVPVYEGEPGEANMLSAVEWKTNSKLHPVRKASKATYFPESGLLILTGENLIQTTANKTDTVQTTNEQGYFVNKMRIERTQHHSTITFTLRHQAQQGGRVVINAPSGAVAMRNAEGPKKASSEPPAYHRFVMEEETPPFKEEEITV